MTHDHSQAGGDRNLGIAFILNLAFTLIEIAGGLWTNSVAILSDALHDFGDCLSLGFAWWMQRVARKESDAAFTYGYRRFSVLGALITGLVLLGGLVFIVWKSAARLLRPEEVHAPGMILIAVIGILFNGAAVLRIRQGHSLNEKVMSWHLLEDVLGWAAVLIGSVVMLLWKLPIIDPLLSIGISVFVFWNVVKNLRKVFLVFLQRAPHGFDAAEFATAAAAVPRVLSVHHTHSWSIDGEHHVLSTHIVIERSAQPEDIAEAKREVRALLSRHEFEHITIETEIEGEECQSPHAHSP